MKLDIARYIKGEMMEFRKSVESDINNIMNIIKQTQEYFKEHGIDQWQDNYPNYEIIMNDILKQDGYVLLIDDKVVATVAVSFTGEKTYKSIYDGRWITANDYGVIHRLAVDSGYKGKGLASKIFKYIEDISLKRDIYSIRIDTHEDNIPMQKAIRKNGFQYCGIIYLEDNSKRIAFERIVCCKCRIKNSSFTKQ